MQSARGERETVPGLIVCVQTFGLVAHLHPHLHVLMTDGAFGRDGTFVLLPEPDGAVLEELWRRPVLAEFVRQGWLEEDAGRGRGDDELAAFGVRLPTWGGPIGACATGGGRAAAGPRRGSGPPRGPDPGRGRDLQWRQGPRQGYVSPRAYEFPFFVGPRRYVTDSPEWGFFRLPAPRS